MHVAKLARLDITEEEADLYASQMSAVLEHAREMETLDIDGIEPTAHPMSIENVLREDVVKPTLDREEVLAAAPDAIGGRFSVPKILGEEA